MSDMSRRRKGAPAWRATSHRPEWAVVLLAWAAAASALVLVLGGCSSGGDDGPMLRTLEPLAGPAEAGGEGQRDGQGQAARLSYPSAAAAAPDGGVWLIDRNGTALRRVDEQGRVRTVRSLQALPSSTDAAGRRVVHQEPQALAVAGDGSVYLAVQRLSLQRQAATPTTADEVVVDARWAVLRVGADGHVAPVAADPQPGTVTQGSRVTAMAVDASGRVHLADGYGCMVWRLEADGALTVVYEGESAGTAQRCGGLSTIGSVVSRLAFDPEGRLVLGFGSGEIWRWAADGTRQRLATRAGTGFACNGLAWLPDGRLVVAGVGNGYALHTASADGTLARWVGDDGDSRWADGVAIAARFGTACSLATDRAGHLLVVDRASHAVRQVDAQARVSTWVGLPTQIGWQDGLGTQARFDAAFGLAAGAASGDELWVADGGNQALRRVTGAGQVRTVSGTPMHGGMPSAVDGSAAQVRWAWPYAVAPRPDGSLWVADGSRVRLQAVDGSVRSLPGELLGTIQALVGTPDGGAVVLAYGFTGTVDGVGGTSFFEMEQRGADGSRRSLLKQGMALIDQRTQPPAQPHGLCRGPDGTLYFSLGHAVLRLDSNGVVQRHAGDLAEPGAADGVATQARFSSPWGLACDAQGRVYVADAGNHTVRRINAQGMVDTVLGRPGVQGHAFGAAPGGLDSPTQVVLMPDGLVVASGLGLVRARW